MKLLNEYLREKFGMKIYKIALNGGCSCPNRDGLIDTRGCIFCSEGGSGEFASSPKLSITEQIEQGKEKVRNKIKNGKYIAYFQAYTGTYAPVNKLRHDFYEAINHPDIAILSIATRPDCLPDDVLELLSDLNKIKPVWVELGLQTIHERTAKYIRRGYNLPVYENAVNELRKRDIEVITHVILGLPGENKNDMLETVKYVCSSGANGIKLQLLHVLKGTDLAKDYYDGKVNILSEDEYLDLLKDCTTLIPDNIIVHRLTGDGDKRLLIAPLWSGNKRHVWNRIHKEIINH